MHIVKPGELTFYPHICDICECGPDDDRKLIDTEITQALDDMDYRKYLCTKCIARGAGVLGLRNPTAELKKLKAENDHFRQHFAELHEFAVGLANATG